VRRPCKCGRPCQVRSYLPHGTSLVQITSSPTGTTWVNEINQGNIGLIKLMRLGSLGSMGPQVQPINHHNRHSKAILGVPERRRFIPQHRGGPAAPRGPDTPPTAILAEIDPRNRPSTASGAVIRSVQSERWWIIGLAAPPHPTTLVKMGPRAQPTSLAYKRNLTLAGMDTQR
jgi:hypothetical protein